jgi:hypothetical protein
MSRRGKAEAGQWGMKKAVAQSAEEESIGGVVKNYYGGEERQHNAEARGTGGVYRGEATRGHGGASE